MVYRAATVQARGMLPPQTWKKTWPPGETVRWKDDLCSTNTPCVRSAGKWAGSLFLAGVVVLGRVRAAAVEGKRRRDVLTVLCKPTGVGAAILCLSHVRKKVRPGHLWELCAVWKWHSNTGLINRASLGVHARNMHCTLAGGDLPLFMTSLGKRVRPICAICFCLMLSYWSTWIFKFISLDRVSAETLWVRKNMWWNNEVPVLYCCYKSKYHPLNPDSCKSQVESKVWRKQLLWTFFNCGGGLWRRTYLNYISNRIVCAAVFLLADSKCVWMCSYILLKL